LAGEYLDRSIGEPAVAAAAIVMAKIKGRNDLLDEVGLEAAIPTISTDLCPEVIAALQRTLEQDSEIRQLWEETTGGSEWVSAVESLLADARHL
jgi:hypothetical protein